LLYLSLFSLEELVVPEVEFVFNGVTLGESLEDLVDELAQRNSFVEVSEVELEHYFVNGNKVSSKLKHSLTHIGRCCYFRNSDFVTHW
jgi:hypothetical protein